MKTLLILIISLLLTSCYSVLDDTLTVYSKSFYDKEKKIYSYSTNSDFRYISRRNLEIGDYVIPLPTEYQIKINHNDILGIDFCYLYNNNKLIGRFNLENNKELDSLIHKDNE